MLGAGHSSSTPGIFWAALYSPRVNATAGASDGTPIHRDLHLERPLLTSSATLNEHLSLAHSTPDGNDGRRAVKTAMMDGDPGDFGRSAHD